MESWRWESQENARKVSRDAREWRWFAVTCFYQSIFLSRFVDYSIFLSCDFHAKYLISGRFDGGKSQELPNDATNKREYRVSAEIARNISSFMNGNKKLTWLASRPRFSSKIRFSIVDFLLIPLHFNSNALKRFISDFIYCFSILFPIAFAALTNQHKKFCEQVSVEIGVRWCAKSACKYLAEIGMIRWLNEI